MKQFIKADWPAPSKIHACTTTRFIDSKQQLVNGLSQVDGISYDANAVQANRLLLKNSLSLPVEPILLQQQHGTRVLDISEMTPTNSAALEHTNSLEADGAYSRSANRICTVITADCLPILLCNKAGTEIAAVHAGWKGLLGGIIENALLTFQSPPQDILAWLGPAIGPTKFEVRADVRDPFIAHDPQHEQAFAPYRPGQWLTDIYLLAKQRLWTRGVTAITGGNFCTYTDSEWFYSYRRDNKKTGRMASLIWIEAATNNSPVSIS
jgi:polyphenol oxidase